MKRLFPVLAVSILMASTTLVLAQDPSVSFSVSSPFKIGEKTFSPGKYRLSYEGKGVRHLQLVELQTNRKDLVPFLTRISARARSGVVFDTLGNDRYLSEVYIAGSDGFHLAGAPGDHAHESADAADSN